MTVWQIIIAASIAVLALKLAGYLCRRRGWRSPRHPASPIC